MIEKVANELPIIKELITVPQKNFSEKIYFVRKQLGKMAAKSMIK